MGLDWAICHDIPQDLRLVVLDHPGLEGLNAGGVFCLESTPSKPLKDRCLHAA